MAELDFPMSIVPGCMRVVRNIVSKRPGWDVEFSRSKSERGNYAILTAIIKREDGQNSSLTVYSDTFGETAPSDFEQRVTELVEELEGRPTLQVGPLRQSFLELSLPGKSEPYSFELVPDSVCITERPIILDEFTGTGVVIDAESIAPIHRLCHLLIAEFCLPSVTPVTLNLKTPDNVVHRFGLEPGTIATEYNWLEPSMFMDDDGIMKPAAKRNHEAVNQVIRATVIVPVLENEALGSDHYSRKPCNARDSGR